MLFAVGALSGTILSFEIGLLWPGLMSSYGDVIGLPFALEGIAFFVEAVFIGIYLYGWGRLSPRVHLNTLIPIMISGAFGTFCIISVNAWMNAPAGFDLDANGEVVDVVDQWRARRDDHHVPGGDVPRRGRPVRRQRGVGRPNGPQVADRRSGDRSSRDRARRSRSNSMRPRSRPDSTVGGSR